MLRRALYAYSIISLALIATSLCTGHRAKTISGNDYFLFTRTHILVDRKLKPTNEADAAFDEGMEAAGESADVPVLEPVFVLGMLDATAPLMVMGGVGLLIAWCVGRRRNKPVEIVATGREPA